MERKVKGEQFMVMVGKRAGPSTPSIAWTHFESSSQNPTPSVSARKLCANLWELHPHYPLPNMREGPPKLHLQHFKDKGFGAGDVDVHHPLPRTPLHQMAPYDPAITPSSSLGFKERNEGSGYRLKPSTELLKVLNRIWALEEHHVSNMSLVKALKTELNLSRARIKELQKQDRTKFAIKSLRDELEDERKLRKHSHSLYRKLARELSEVKSCFADAMDELERERKTRTLLENLCDEFAIGVQCLKHKHHGVDQVDGENPEGLILHISKAWLNERMQIKPTEKINTIIDKLSLDIQTFLEAKCELIKENGSCRYSLESFPLNEAVSAPQGAADEYNSSHSNKQFNELNKTAKMRPQNSGKGCKLHHSRGLFDDKVHSESKFREDLRVIRSVDKGRASSPVRQWISMLKSPDFKKSDYSSKLRKRIH